MGRMGRSAKMKYLTWFTFHKQSFIVLFVGLPGSSYLGTSRTLTGCRHPLSSQGLTVKDKIMSTVTKKYGFTNLVFFFEKNK